MQDTVEVGYYHNEKIPYTEKDAWIFMAKLIFWMCYFTWCLVMFFPNTL